MEESDGDIDVDEPARKRHKSEYDDQQPQILVVQPLIEPKLISIPANNNGPIRVEDIGGQYDCRHCSARFSEHEHMLQHIRTHHGDCQHVCTECRKGFLTLEMLESHVKTHRQDQPYVCTVPECGKKYRRKAHLQRHMLAHTGERPFGCPQCDGRFTRKEKLQRHIRVHHTREKPFQCKDCGKAFARQWHLHRHTLTHTGEQPYACSQCSRSFSQSAHLRTHERTQHADTQQQQAVRAEPHHPPPPPTAPTQGERAGSLQILTSLTKRPNLVDVPQVTVVSHFRPTGAFERKVTAARTVDVATVVNEGDPNKE